MHAMLIIVSYLFRLARLEEGGHIEGELGDQLVLTQAAAHLAPRTHLHHDPHLLRARIPLDVGRALAVAEVWVAGGVEDASLDGAVLVVEGAVDVGPVLEHAVAPVDALGAQVSQLVS